MNALDLTPRILQVMSNYVQVVTESTQMSGVLLDHVFVRKDLYKQLKLEVLLEHYILVIMMLLC